MSSCLLILMMISDGLPEVSRLGFPKVRVQSVRSVRILVVAQSESFGGSQSGIGTGWVPQHACQKVQTLTAH